MEYSPAFTLSELFVLNDYGNIVNIESTALGSSRF